TRARGATSSRSGTSRCGTAGSRSRPPGTAWPRPGSGPPPMPIWGASSPSPAPSPAAPARWRGPRGSGRDRGTPRAAGRADSSPPPLLIDRSYRAGSVPDVLVPELRPGTDEGLHQPDALLVVEDLHDHAPGPQVVFRASERLVLADDDPGDLVQERRARAHV